MAKKRAPNKKKPLPKKKSRSIFFEAEALGLVFLSLAFFLILSQLSFYHHAPDKNWLGIVGYSLGLICHYTFGLSGHVFSLILAHIGTRFLMGKKIEHFSWHLFYVSLFLFSSSILFNLFADQIPSAFTSIEPRLYTESILVDGPRPYLHLRHNAGGVFSYYLLKDLPHFNLLNLLSASGVTIVFSILLVASSVFLGHKRLFQFASFLQKKRAHSKKIPKKSSFSEKALLYLKSYLEHKKTVAPAKKVLSSKTPVHYEGKPRIISPTFPKLDPKTSSQANVNSDADFNTSLPLAKPRKKKASAEELSAQMLRAQALRSQRVYNGDFAGYILPKSSLLKAPKNQDQTQLKKDLMRLGHVLEETLLSFGIEGKVGNIHCGPRIASFEVHPPVGVKVQKI